MKAAYRCPSATLSLTPSHHTIQRLGAAIDSTGAEYNAALDVDRLEPECVTILGRCLVLHIPPSITFDPCTSLLQHNSAVVYRQAKDSSIRWIIESSPTSIRYSVRSLTLLWLPRGPLSHPSLRIVASAKPYQPPRQLSRQVGSL